MSEINYENITNDLDNIIMKMKILLEHVLKMRINCAELELKMLRLYHPSCLQTEMTEDCLNIESSFDNRKTTEI